MSVCDPTAKRNCMTALATCLGAVAFLAAAGQALAQQDKQDTRREQSGAKVTVVRDNTDRQDKGESDADLLNENYQPKGIEMGQFLLMPKFEVSEAYNSNIYATAWGTKDDSITVLRPEVKLRSRFTEHELNFSAMVEDYRYARFTDENRTDFNTYVDGRYDINSDTKITHLSMLTWGHEERTSPDAVNGVSPGTNFSNTNRTGIQGGGGRIKLLGEAGYDRKEWGAVDTSAGTQVYNGDRNRWEFQLRERASYEMFPGYAALVELTENTHRYDSSSDRNGYDRNSKGYRAEAGIGVDISKLIRGDFLIGYMKQDYRDGRFKDPSGLAMRASFNWTPTKLTSIQPALERSVQDTTTARASGMVHSIGSLTVKHELARNMVVTGFGSLSKDEYQGVDGQDFWTYEVGGHLIYSFRPELYMAGEVKYRNKDSDMDASSYKQAVMMVRFGVQY